ncbi:MAG: alpha/beta hydrolase-fold protein [Magnetospirillum sp.]|nr:alpha/beta hydrolase-fold protein [Magnetospirillum sp.]
MRRFAARCRLLALPFLMVLQACSAGSELSARVETFDLQASGAAGGTYRVLLALPAEPVPPQGYPVIYLLDGNATLPMMLAAQDAARAGQGPAAVVGVGYPIDGPFDVQRRYWDLTPPTPPEYLLVKDGAPPPATGGRDVFWAFMERDLRPAIERRLPVDRARQTLYGHSLAGLFTLHVLFTHPDAFQTYVAADPSIWWNDRSVLAEQAAFLDRWCGEERHGGRRIKLLVEIAGGKPATAGRSEGELARIAKLRSGPTGRDVARTLRDVPGFDVLFREFPEEGHGSMLPLSVADALAFALGNAPVGADAPTDGPFDGKTGSGCPRALPPAAE